MIGLAVRLTVASGREAGVRLATTAAAVTIGVALVLLTLAGIRGVDAQNARYAWLIAADVATTPGPADVDPLWAALDEDVFEGDGILVADVAATGPSSPVPTGMDRLPAAGEYYASPALAALIGSHPAAELGDRFPGRQIGVLRNDALPGPSALLAVVGRPVAELSARSDAGELTSINTVSPDECDTCTSRVGIDANGIILILSVVLLAMLFPLVVFVGASTRLSAARREQRFAALRLVGATNRQIAVASAVESTTAAVMGTGLGFVLFFLLRPAVALIPFTGERFFTADLSVGVADVIAVVVGIPLVSMLVARLALRRVAVSPLGVARRVTPRPPRAWRLLPVALGVTDLVFFGVGPTPDSGVDQVGAYLPGFLLIMIGLVLSGPWLTMIGARWLVRRAAAPATLIAGRRLADNPGSGFRAVSGVVLALFVTSVAVGVITTFSAHRGAPPADQALADTMFQQAAFDSGSGLPVTPAGIDRLRAEAGVSGAVAFHRDPAADLHQAFVELNAFASCAQLASSSALGTCPAGVAVVRINAYLDAAYDGTSTRPVWPAAALTVDDLAALPVESLAVATDGRASTVERVRTVLELASPGVVPPTTPGESQRMSSQDLVQYQQLATVVVVTSLPIAGCSLAVSVVGGLADRRRPFSLLRLTGASTAMLRRVVVLESVAPLVVGAVAAVGIGLASAHLFTEAQLGYSLTLPGFSYWALVVGGLVLALLVVGSTLPLVHRTTGPEVARND